MTIIDLIKQIKDLIDSTETLANLTTSWDEWENQALLNDDVLTKINELILKYAEQERINLE